jgi:hypothetical protein
MLFGPFGLFCSVSALPLWVGLAVGAIVVWLGAGCVETRLCSELCGCNNDHVVSRYYRAANAATIACSAMVASEYKLYI